MSTRWILNPVKFPTNPYLQSMQKETNSECLRMNVSPFLLNCCLFSSSSRSLLPMYAYIYICLYLYNDPQNQTFQWTKNDNFNPICSMYGIYIYISTNTQRMTQLYIRFCLKTGYPITSTGYIIKKWPVPGRISHFQAISTILWLLVTFIPLYPHHYPTLLLPKYI